MSLKRALAQWKFQSQLRKFKRVYRWYNAEDVKPGMTVFLNGRVLEIGEYNLAVLGRITITSRSSGDPVAMYQVILTPHAGYQAFYQEGANLDPNDVLVSDLKRVVEDPVYSKIYYSTRIKRALVEEASLLLNNEGLRNLVKRVREEAIRKVEFPYWNLLGGALLAARILQNGQLYRRVPTAVVGALLASHRYLGLPDKAWKYLAGEETAGESIREVAEALKAEHPEQIRWMYGNLPDRKYVAEVIDYSMFMLGKIQKESQDLAEPAQAVGMAMAFDAATHDRPYRKGRPTDQVLKDLEESFLSGWEISADGTVTKRGRFDPKIWDGLVATVTGTDLRL